MNTFKYYFSILFIFISIFFLKPDLLTFKPCRRHDFDILISLLYENKYAPNRVVKIWYSAIMVLKCLLHLPNIRPLF